MNDRSEPDARVRADPVGFEARSGTTQRGAERVWTILVPAQ
ncbi:hypothetical protein [Cognatazoarcus halotolerans]|nr:hypothetical protein [Cognatazoarcus halotolerans]